MPRGKLDLEKIRASLNTPCPHCVHSITAEERTHLDREHIIFRGRHLKRPAGFSLLLLCLVISQTAWSQGHCKTFRCPTQPRGCQLKTAPGKCPSRCDIISYPKGVYSLTTKQQQDLDKEIRSSRDPFLTAVVKRHKLIVSAMPNLPLTVGRYTFELLDPITCNVLFHANGIVDPGF